jgi:formylglycine-generating enzyme required for sulfatase activity
LTLGTQWFLSYHSPDQALARRLKDSIERKTSGARVFFGPTELRAGGFWSPQLAQGIADASGFILLVGEHGIGNWQVLEYNEALDKRVRSPDFPIVVVLLEGHAAPGLPFLRQLHWIVTSDPSSDKDVARLLDAAAGGHVSPGEQWRYTSPYRGLAAMHAQDSDYFFGRERETVGVIEALATARGKLPLLLGNSGVGKSSLAEAGVLAALMRQSWPETSSITGPWPAAFRDSRQWCLLTLRPGAEPVKSLVEAFLGTWQLDSTSTDWPERRAQWVESLLANKLGLGDLLDQTTRRYRELHLSAPAAFLLCVDQGEELYVRAEERQRRRFSELVNRGLEDPRIRALMSLRADFYGELQKDEALYCVHQAIGVPPLREAELNEVVSRPAKLLSARFDTDGLASSIAHRTAEESTKDAGALPLLSYLLDDMWSKMVRRGDGILRLPVKAIELGGVLVERADTFLAAHPNSEGSLRHIFTLRLATVREDGEPTRRRASRNEFTDDEWRLVSELANYPNRLLVTVTPEAGEGFAEVAHEAIFRHWEKLRDWIAAEREFLAWRTGLEAARRTWQATAAASRGDALLMGAALTQARSWLMKRGEDLPLDREFIEQSIERHKKATRRARRVRALSFALLIGIIVGLVAWMNEAYLQDRWRWLTTIRPYMIAHVRPLVLSPARERGLRPKDTFKECDGHCPEMIVIPAGEFLMGSAPDEKGHSKDEGPQHRVRFERPFAVSMFPVTFAEWDACVAYGDCDAHVSDSRFGRGQHPVINVSRADAQRYATWLSRMTGKRYRLLSESEFEYAARAGTTTAYSWGADIGPGHANCTNCPGKREESTTVVGSFPSNPFGLYDMPGNVWHWVGDCMNDDYRGAPQDGSAWTTKDCSRSVARGGSWSNSADDLRSAARGEFWSDFRAPFIGFRVARSLTP